MLWRRVRRTTASTGVALTVTHALGVIPEVWMLEPCSDRGLGRSLVVPGTLTATTLIVRNSIGITVTLDVFVFTFKGELY
jgi:hypothetical protein